MREINDLDTKLNNILVPTMMITTVLMLVIFIVSGIYNQKYMTGQITLEEFTTMWKFVIFALVANMLIPIIFIVIASIKYKFEFLEFQGEQSLLDTHQSVVVFSPKKVSEYQWQTNPTAENDVIIFQGMIDVIKSTSSFNTLFNKLEGAGGIVNLDQSNIFETFYNDVETLNAFENQALVDLKEQLERLITSGKEIKKLKFGMSRLDDQIDKDLFDDENDDDNDRDEKIKDDLDEIDYHDERSDYFDEYETQRTKVIEFFDKLSEYYNTRLEKELLIEKQKLAQQAQVQAQAQDPQQANKQLEIRTESPTKEKNININFDVLTRAGLIMSLDPHWKIGFRKLESICCLDDIREEETYFDEKLKQEVYFDDFLNSEAVCYLIPGPEKRVFNYHKRMSLDMNFVKVRKAYTNWHFAGWIVDKVIPLIVLTWSANSREIYNLRLSSESFDDAKMIAYAQLTYMSYFQNEALHSRIIALEADNSALKTKNDQIEQQNLEQWIDSMDFARAIEKRFEAKPLNVTSIVFGFLMLIVGFLAGRRGFA